MIPYSGRVKSDDGKSPVASVTYSLTYSNDAYSVAAEDGDVQECVADALERISREIADRHYQHLLDSVYAPIPIDDRLGLGYDKRPFAYQLTSHPFSPSYPFVDFVSPVLPSALV